MKGASIFGLVVLFTAGIGIAQEDKDKNDPKYTEWKAWASFADGSWTKIEMISKFGERETKMVTTTTRISQEDENITVEAAMKMGSMDLPARKRQIKKPKATEDPQKKTCEKCGKAQHTEFKWSKGKVKIGEKELNCHIVVWTSKDCEGKDQGSGKAYYSKDVPGWVVKLESKIPTGTVTMTCVGFGKK